MNQSEHLKTYKLTLLTKAPLFIGSGQKYNKKEYYFDSQQKRAIFINTKKFFSLLSEKKLLDKYEQYIYWREDIDLKGFLDENGIYAQKIQEIKDYDLNTGNAIDKNHSLAEVHQFIRDANMRPYVPGSSVKGCLRTAILWNLIKENESIKSSIEKQIEKQYNENDKKVLNLEVEYLNAVNSIMRAISISDSIPIDNSKMSLAAKIDISVKGKEKPIKKVVREVIIPETKIHFILTIDESINKNLNVDFIRKVISEYGDYYKETFAESFKTPPNAICENFKNCIVLGGGSGYFGKNICYPYYGKDKAVEKVSEIMSRQFRNHNHEKDKEIGISPHMLKHTHYNKKSYHFGVCEVKIEDCANVKQP